MPMSSPSESRVDRDDGSGEGNGDGSGIDGSGNGDGDGAGARSRIGVELKGGSGFGVVKKRVYVGNLSWSTRWQDLKDHMRKAGEVVHAEIFTESFGRSAGCGIVEFETSSDAENAIISMNDSMLDGRQIFVRADREEGRKTSSARSNHHHHHHYHHQHNPGSRYGGSNNNSDDGGGYRRRKENVTGGMNGHSDVDGNRDSGERGRKIVIWNLPFHIRWQDLKDVCREYGTVIRADVPHRPDGKSKGMGMVLFEKADEAERAITGITGKEIDGRIVDCRHDKYA